MRTPTKSNPISKKISKSPTGNASKDNPTNRHSRTDEPTVFGFLWKKAKQLMSIFYNVLFCIQNCKAAIRKVQRLPI